MDNPENLATQDKRQRQTKPKHTNTLCVRHHYSQQNKTKHKKRHESSYKQLEVNTEPNIVFMWKSLND
jgi:hypothetical protein